MQKELEAVREQAIVLSSQNAILRAQLQESESELSEWRASRKEPSQGSAARDSKTACKPGDDASGQAGDGQPKIKQAMLAGSPLSAEIDLNLARELQLQISTLQEALACALAREADGLSKFEDEVSALREKLALASADSQVVHELRAEISFLRGQMLSMPSSLVEAEDQDRDAGECAGEDRGSGHVMKLRSEISELREKIVSLSAEGEGLRSELHKRETELATVTLKLEVVSHNHVPCMRLVDFVSLRAVGVGLRYEMHHRELELVTVTHKLAEVRHGRISALQLFMVVRLAVDGEG